MRAAPPRRGVWAGRLAVAVLGLLLLLLLNRLGVVSLGAVGELFLYQRVVLSTNGPDLVVEFRKTTDQAERPNRWSTVVEPPHYTDPYRTTQVSGTRTVKLPPGNYWLWAKRDGRLVHRQLLRVGWGGEQAVPLPSRGKAEERANP